MDRHVALTLLSLTACGGAEGLDAPDVPALYASELVRFEPGTHAGFGADQLPEVVFGPPRTSGEGGGSLDVVSLGVGGEIVLGFGAREVVNGPGADFVIFENPFTVQGSPGDVFAELGEVSVSEDGQTWHTFACDPSGIGAWPGCAGWRPARDFDPALMDPLDPQQTGGDAFDLDDLGLEAARFVRIRDLATQGKAPSGGFDLDAIGLVHLR